MAMTVTPGTRLYSTVCSTELITVKAPAGEVDLTIGGAPAGTAPPEARDESALVEGQDAGAAIGKRYVNEDETLEVLCTKAGPGVPAIGGTVLTIKGAKPLPSSD